jgi:hypothetical protein
MAASGDRGDVAERFRRIERAAFEENFVGDSAVAPAADIGKSGSGHAALVSEKNDNDAGHRLFRMSRFAISLDENMLRKLKLALAQNRVGNRPVRLSEHKKRRLSFEGHPVAREWLDLLVRGGEIQSRGGVFSVVDFLRGLELRSAQPAVRAVLEPDVKPAFFRGDDFKFVFGVGAKENLGCIGVLLKDGRLRRLHDGEVRQELLSAGIRFELGNLLLELALGGLGCLTLGLHGRNFTCDGGGIGRVCSRR